MGKNTNILIGAGALAVVYYLYNASKASASVSPNGATLPPISTNPPPPDYKPLPPSKPDVMVFTPLPEFFEKRELDRIEKEKAAELGKAELARLAKIEEEKAAELAKAKLARLTKIEEEKAAELALLAEIKAYEEENARIKAINIANQKAYEASDEFLRQKAMNAFMYPTCPDGFEFYQNNCMPTYIIVEEKAKKGEGLVLRDFKSNTTTLVQTCPAEYVKQGITCIPRNSLSPQQLQVLSMEEAGMVQTSDGQWYTSAEAAAIAQAKIDNYNSTPNSTQKYTPRQNNINIAICSIDRDGYINNFNSPTNGMSLSKYIGEFKVKSSELGIARASCPNSVYSSNLIAGGRTDDNALGYKGI